MSQGHASGCGRPDDAGVTTARLLSAFGEGVVEHHWPGLHELEVSSNPARNPYYRYGASAA